MTAGKGWPVLDREKLKREMSRKLGKEEAYARCIVLGIAALVMAAVLACGMRGCIALVRAAIGG